MKPIILFLLLLGFANPLTAQEPEKYDAALAEKLGADDYGMKRYYLLILKTGTSELKDKIVIDSLFQGHMANIRRLASEGLLVVAGPLGKNDRNYRGIFILNVQSAEEAEKLVFTDPAVKENLLAAEFFSLYGSAALMEIPALHKKITRPTK